MDNRCNWKGINKFGRKVYEEQRERGEGRQHEKSKKNKKMMKANERQPVHFSGEWIQCTVLNCTDWTNLLPQNEPTQIQWKMCYFVANSDNSEWKSIWLNIHIFVQFMIAHSTHRKHNIDNNFVYRVKNQKCWEMQDFVSKTMAEYS